ncbi:ORF6N domain-containing protein [Candidatus Woesearchaeota archaeon]|jgi:hypothetical protein|nr:ORF6N domain-containing protein [Candidatus Woesearchaeota archaeon]MBT4151324.1 ORF6N domain-containing protein [Candidatus Woesearchaeota archaeon]MBT4247439.1 ORF6N domain-containing protein [Candidatus Woesearchaeota archaeon]MBT4434146.1 ORF6N domain-containing protein [Candidatus Woesearchaeota archaeon]
MSLISKKEIALKNKIYAIRGLQVMLDRDLAELYEVPTKVLNQAVKRNIERFPNDFMFQLTKNELENLKFQNGTSSDDSSMSQNVTLETKQDLRSQIVTSKYGWGGTRKLSYVFTEQGVATLSGVLKSKKAIEVNIKIMRAFVTMRRFISKNAEIFYRLDSLEKKQIKSELKIEHVFALIESKDLKPNKGIFFEGQIFDAYKFISDLLRTAHKSIILIDNFIDDSVLTLFQKCNKEIKIMIYTKDLSKQLKLDLKKYNSQYNSIEVKEFSKSHDRFIIIDDKEVYHIGASLKDLGKKWFAFSKFDKEALKIIEKLD